MSKSNKLTLWIFIALVVGIITGYALNKAYPAPERKSYTQAVEALAAEFGKQ